MPAEDWALALSPTRPEGLRQGRIEPHGVRCRGAQWEKPHALRWECHADAMPIADWKERRDRMRHELANGEWVALDTGPSASEDSIDGRDVGASAFQTFSGQVEPSRPGASLADQQ